MAKEATLKIGNTNVEKESILGVAEAIERIFKSAFENGIEQETLRTALNTLGNIAKIESVSVSNSVFKGDKTVNMGDDEEEGGIK